MADLILENCSNEGDLAQIAQALLDEAADIRDQILSQIQNMTPALVSSIIDDANSKYDQAIAPNDNDNIANQIGLPVATPSDADDEARLEPLGLVMIRGIIYALGTTDDNIEKFRKLFFAVGSNVTLFLDLLKSTNNLIVVQTKLVCRKLPDNPSGWTLDGARELFQNDAIEKLYQAGDGAYYAITPQFLSVNKSAEQTALELNMSRSEIVTQVFWLREVENNSARINQLLALGLDVDERTAILTDQPVKDVRPTVVENLRVDMDNSVRKALDQMELLNSRFSLVTPDVRETFRNEILVSLDEGRSILLDLERKVRFAPILITRPEDMDDFLKRNKPEDIPYLFATRRTVKAINFEIAQSELMALIRNASSIPSGSNTVSSVLSNSPVTTLDYDVDSTNESWVLNECGRVSLSKQGEIRWNDLSTAYQCVSSIRTRPVIPEVSNIPVIGYESYDNPSSIMFRRANLMLTLDIPNIFDKILSLAEPLTALLREAIKVLVAMLKAMRQAVDAILQPLIEKVKDTVAQIEAFVSRHCSYFATAGIDSSILKCALNLDLQASLPFLADLPPFLEDLQRLVQNLISQIAQIMSDFLDKLACLPMNFLNDLLKSTTSFLPAFCKTDDFQLPDDLQAALAELRQGFQLEQTIYRNFSTNLLRLDATVTSLPSQINSFKEDLTCNQTPLNSRFMSIFKLAGGLGLGANPISGIASTVSGALGGAGGGDLLSRASSLIPPRG